MVILMMNMTINTMNWGNSASPRVDANSFDLFRGYHPETINYDKFILKWGCSLLFVNWWLVHPGVTFGYLHFMQEITIKPPFNPYSWAIATKKNIRKKRLMQNPNLKFSSQLDLGITCGLWKMSFFELPSRFKAASTSFTSASAFKLTASLGSSSIRSWEGMKSWRRTLQPRYRYL